MSSNVIAQVEFEIVARPFSINATSHRDKRYSTVAYLEWQEAILQKLLEHKGPLDKMSAKAKMAGKSTFSIDFCFKYPPEIYYNKQGLISSKTIDISNCEKTLLDVIFAGVLDINDKRVTALNSTKCSSSHYAISIKIELLEPKKQQTE